MIRNIFIYLSIILTIAIISSGWKLNNISTDDDIIPLHINNSGDIDLPACLELYNIIEEKSEEYNIPKYILYNVAYLETRYLGPFHWTYNPDQISSAGAQGAMQIITRYAHVHAGRTVSSEELRKDLELNVIVSCSMLSNLYKRYGRWDLALGYYNTGRPQVNSYASYGASTTNYKGKWIKLKQ